MTSLLTFLNFKNFEIIITSLEYLNIELKCVLTYK